MKYLILIFLFSCGSASHESLPTFDRELTGFKYPFSVKNYEFNSQKQTLKMAYMDLNSKAKKTIVLMHGKNFAGFYWERVAKDLVKKGFRVVIPDQIGFGKSSKPDSYQFSFYNLALNTMSLLEEIGVKNFTLVGHSMGGMLATHFTYLFPKKVSKMILINPIGLEPYLKYVQYKDPQFFYKIELNKTPEKFKAYQKKNYYDGKWRSDYDHLLVPYSGQMRGKDWDLVAWNNALTYGPIFSEDITTKFKDLNLPVVLILGTRDKTGPGRNWKKPGVTKTLGRYDRLGKEVLKLLPKGELYELKGLGHMPQFEDYERFSKTFFEKAL
ncbi:MAG: alpha/beta hydrolase [Halobacteriovoraceae bacterium]|nr:alpha/beta hydrolase [Halobacteriovoraceae bacterium]